MELVDAAVVFLYLIVAAEMIVAAFCDLDVVFVVVAAADLVFDFAIVIKRKLFLLLSLLI